MAFGEPNSRPCPKTAAPGSRAAHASHHRAQTPGQVPTSCTSQTTDHQCEVRRSWMFPPRCCYRRCGTRTHLQALNSAFSESCVPHPGGIQPRQQGRLRVTGLGGAWARHDQLRRTPRCCPKRSGHLAVPHATRRHPGSSTQRGPVRQSHRLPPRPTLGMPPNTHSGGPSRFVARHGALHQQRTLSALREQPWPHAPATEEKSSDQSQAISRAPVRPRHCRTPSTASHGSCQDGD